VNDTVDEVKCSEIESLTVPASNETRGEATFIEEAGACAVVTADQSYNTINPVERVQSIKEYFERPRLFADGELSGIGLVNIIDIRTSNNLRTIFSSIAWDRLRGATGIRGTLRFHLVVSATPFHAGLLSLNWQYGLASTVQPNITRANFWPLTNHLPHVKLDLAEATEAVLDVPYVAPREYWPLNSNANDTIEYGVLAINSLADVPLVEGQLNPEWSLYVSMHDVEIIGVSPYNLSSITTQSGVSAKSFTRKEAEATGVVSGPLRILADASRVIAGIPQLTAIGGMADWFFRASSKAAEAFGFSKPQVELAPTRVYRAAFANDNHVDVPTVANVTGPFQSNKLAIGPVLGCTSDDQLSMDYVLTKPSIIFRGQMTTSLNPGSVMYSTNLAPGYFWYRDQSLGSDASGNKWYPQQSSDIINAFLPSTLCYVGNNFKMWRGGFRFKITFVKTKLHGGRVQLSYVPYTANNGAGIPNSTVLAPEVSSGRVQAIGACKVFDLRDGSSFEMDVPYLAIDPYVSFNTSIGGLSMHVVNALRAPIGASTTIDYIVEVSALPGFEFAVHNPGTMTGPSPTGTVTVTYQSGLNATLKDDSSQHIVGEKFMSLKQLMMIPSWFVFDVGNATNFRFTLRPWFGFNQMPLSVPMPADTNATAAFLAANCYRVAQMFSFVNGSTDWSFYRDNADRMSVTAYSVPTAITATNDSSSLNSNQWSWASATNIMEPTANSTRFRVPAYARYARLPTAIMFDACGGWRRTINPGGEGRFNFDYLWFLNKIDLQVRNLSGNAQRTSFGCAAGDDAMASQFVGPPPVILYSPSAVSAVNACPLLNSNTLF
jgi:hypothetical protein